jgi:hypothetical protein
MAIRLPDLSGSKCRYVITCGSVQETDNQEFLDWVKIDRTMIAAWEPDGHKHFVRLRTGGDFPTHFHLDVVSTDFFEKSDDFPATTNSLDELLAAAERIVGHDIGVHADAHFVVPLGELPALISMTIPPVVIGKVTVKMTEGALSVEGAPIHSIRWTVKGGKEAIVTLKARRFIRAATESYLFDVLSLLREVFDGLMTGRLHDGQTKKQN